LDAAYDSVLDEPQPELNLLVHLGNPFCKNLCFFCFFFSLTSEIFPENEMKNFLIRKKGSDFEGFQLPEVSVKKCKKLYIWDFNCVARSIEG
jgi:coproporphyrinogen III oxidase-like Fe-S oxidoreductase